MKLLYQTVRQKIYSSSEQDRLIKFVGNKETIKKAVEGSMTKRIEIFDKADLKKTVL